MVLQDCHLIKKHVLNTSGKHTSATIIESSRHLEVVQLQSQRVDLTKKLEEDPATQPSCHPLLRLWKYHRQIAAIHLDIIALYLLYVYIYVYAYMYIYIYIIHIYIYIHVLYSICIYIYICIHIRYAYIGANMHYHPRIHVHKQRTQQILYETASPGCFFAFN